MVSEDETLNKLSMLMKKRVEEHAKDIYSKALDDIQDWFYSDWESNFKIYVEDQARRLVVKLMKGEEVITNVVNPSAYEKTFKKIVEASESAIIKSQEKRIEQLEEEIKGYKVSLWS